VKNIIVLIVLTAFLSSCNAIVRAVIDTESERSTQNLIDDTHRSIENLSIAVLKTNSNNKVYYSQFMVLKIDGWGDKKKLNAAPEITWYSNNVEVKKEYGGVYLPTHTTLPITYKTNEFPENFKVTVILRNAYNAILSQNTFYFNPTNSLQFMTVY
jgi:hypothetical protein